MKVVAILIFLFFAIVDLYACVTKAHHKKAKKRPVKNIYKSTKIKRFIEIEEVQNN